ncbi:MocR-like pyridoxine biosynthesis transcription factor PdxR [Robbsia andropogonis]|uniref:MocR-like pyridoxine biosynthesis transcription factor PdxR n=1 Tax=Robbsia andropogonis TaxID=28092 RepID=UPI00389AE2EB
MLDLTLNKELPVPLFRQLCDQLRDHIMAGRLATGFQLPSSREMALFCNIGRNTVAAAIDQLVMEGFLSASRGRRPRVSALPSVEKSVVSAEKKWVARHHPAQSQWAMRISKMDCPPPTLPRTFPFTPGFGDPREFPHDIWARCLRSGARRNAITPATRSPINCHRLQWALLRYLGRSKGIRATTSRIFILPSAQSALELIARTILNPGDVAWIESPGYRGVRAAIRSVGAHPVGVEVDRAGMSGDVRHGRPRVIFVTRSHQYPTGALMSVTRRQALLHMAAEHNALVVEIDYDSDFHYEGHRLTALQSLDTFGTGVVHVGTFAQTTFADIRVGYVIVPDWLVDIFHKAQHSTGQFVPAAAQEALATFVEDGHFLSHVRRMTRVYQCRRDYLVETLRGVLPHSIQISPPAGGMQLLLRLATDADDVVLAAALASENVIARSLSKNCLPIGAETGLVLGFAAWRPDEMWEGIQVLARLLQPRGTKR